MLINAYNDGNSTGGLLEVRPQMGWPIECAEEQQSPDANCRAR
jgi:hypothetical protein